MTKPSWFSPAQMQALNPALVMLIIPFNNLVLWPALRKRGREPTQLGKMTLGIALAAVAWVIVGTMQLVLDGGTLFPITWQILPYIFLTSGEVLVSATGLEFAYSQAPLVDEGRDHELLEPRRHRRQRLGHPREPHRPRRRR